MGKKYEGVREKVKGKRYEIYFRPYKGAKKIHRNIEASSLTEAYYKRQEIVAASVIPASYTPPKHGRGRKRLLGVEDVVTLRDDFNAGLSKVALANKYGVSVSTVRRYICIY